MADPGDGGPEPDHLLSMPALLVVRRAYGSAAAATADCSQGIALKKETTYRIYQKILPGCYNNLMIKRKKAHMLRNSKH